MGSELVVIYPRSLTHGPSEAVAGISNSTVCKKSLQVSHAKPLILSPAPTRTDKDQAKVGLASLGSLADSSHVESGLNQVWSQP